MGSGSYTKTHPGVDAAGRNGVPPGTAQLSGNAVGKPVPTNDWWSAKLNNNHVNNIFNYPLGFRTHATGLVTSYVVPSSTPQESREPMSDVMPVTVGVTGLNATRATISDYSDWTVTMNWANGTHSFDATIGMAMPITYYTKAASDEASVTVTLGTVTIANEMLLILNSQRGANFAVYAPTGSTWTKTGNTYTSSLNGKNYWSMAFLPPSATNAQAVANEYKRFAYVFPIDTRAVWAYNESSSTMKTDFTVTPVVKEGVENKVLLGLLPHQWDYLASSSAQPEGYSYPSVRGEIKTIAGNTFSVENKFHGILPTLPYVSNYSQGFSPAALASKIQSIENNGLDEWTDSYNEGQMMNRLIQTARIADLMGNTAARDKMLQTIKTRLEDWLSVENGEKAFLFYYSPAWTALIGYPAGHGQDNNLNDHHFHWGYFIHAASFVEQFQPGWAAQWGEMVNMLVKDSANPNRTDEMFPFLRNFNPYSGHSWSNGFASFPFGNDQESTSESMQFNSSLIHWGTITGNTQIRDLGIYLYTTEQTAIEEYWFDIHNRTLKPEYQYSLVSRIWGAGYDRQTFWTSDIAATYGIEMYPIHGGSLYLGHHLEYSQKLWDEISRNTGILTNEANPNLWHDVMWEYLSFIDPAKAIELYNSNPNRSLKFGISDAQTYYWLHSMNALGKVDATVTANYPIAASFLKNGQKTYVAHNYSNAPITVTFSDGGSLTVPARSMATSKDVAVGGTIATNYTQVPVNGSVELTVSTTGSGVTAVEFFDCDRSLGRSTTAPFKTTVANLAIGVHQFYARVYAGTNFTVTNSVAVQVGGQVAYSGTPAVIPGTIEAGLYDKYEGGLGQGITYNDATAYNEGNFRKDEHVDASQEGAEGATVGWIDAGEWMEYTVQVTEPGIYSVAIRYASGAANGGGPFHLQLDGRKVGADITVASTGDWGAWATKNVTGLELTSGEHVLRVQVTQGGFNLGKMTFTRTAPLPYGVPVANAGANVIVVLPQATATLNGSGSSHPDGTALTYAWTQIYGPSTAVFSSNTAINPTISGLVEGVYQLKLTVSDGINTAQDEVLVIVSADAKIKPIVSLTSPAPNTSVTEGATVSISASAEDVDGTVQLVEFYLNGNKIDQSTGAPYQMNWTARLGTHQLTAKATDNDGGTSLTQARTLTVTQAPSCTGGPANGDYTYEFSQDSDNPTLTFRPGRTGVGSPTLLFYYSTSANGPFPGRGVTANTPFQVTASRGQTIYFYFTYSTSAGEANTANAKHSFVIGGCGSTTTNTAPVAMAGPDRTIQLPMNSLTLNGAGSYDPDGDVLTYAWTKVSGPAVTMGTTSQSTLSLSDLVVGTYAFDLTVADGRGGTHTARMTLTVQSPNSVYGALDGNFRFYPNPVVDFLHLELEHAKGELVITDIAGSRKQTVSISSTKPVLDLRNYAAGVYFITITQDKKTVRLKVLKR